jgi:hypothetical protein
VKSFLPLLKMHFTENKFTSLQSFPVKYFLYIFSKYGLRTLRGHILNIWKMRNLNIWLVDPFQIWSMKSAHFAIQGFDWVLVSRVVCIIQIFRICPLRVCNPYIKFFCECGGFDENFKKYLSLNGKLSNFSVKHQN